MHTGAISARHLIGFALLLAGVGHAFADPAPACEHTLVEAKAMREVMVRIDGYDTGAVINQSRFVADFLLGLAARDDVAGATGTFQIQPERFFQAWLDVTGEGVEDAPVSMRKVLEFNQRFTIDARSPFRLAPAWLEAQTMLAVRVSWPETPEAADDYVYEDTMADPSVRMRHSRVITYTLIDFGEFVAYENIEGIRGKPTSGALGALFNFLGTARIVSSRYAVAEDQTQVNRSRLRKLFPFTALTTIAPDGTAERGIPDDRTDLQALADRLDRDFEIDVEQPPPTPCPFHE